MISPTQPSPLDSSRRFSTERNEGVEPGSGNGHLADAYPNPLEPFLRHWGELRQELSQYVALQTDHVKLHLQSTLIYAGLACGAGVVGLAALVMAVVLILRGCTEGLTLLLGGRGWAAELIVGIAVMILGASAVVAAMKAFVKNSRQRTIEKHEHRRYQHDAAQSRAQSELASVHGDAF